MQRNPLRVLFITSTFPRNKADVLANWIGQLATRLKDKGIQVEVIAPSCKGMRQNNYMDIVVHRFRYAPAFLETLTQDQGAIFKMRGNPLFVLLVPFYLLCGFWRTLRVVSQSHYDVVCIHWPFPNGLFGILAKIVGKSKLVLTFYGAEFALVRRVPFGISILRFIVQQADSIIANSKFTQRELEKIIHCKVNVIPFGSTIPIERVKKTVINDLQNQNAEKKILFVGRLIERKGVRYLIDALVEVARDIPARLDIIGNGPLRNQLNRQIKQNGLEDIAVIHGNIGGSELEKYYQNCDVFVLPAVVDKWGDTEGQGVVLLEALTFKKPVVASSVGGIVDIVQNGKTGILVPEKNPLLLARAIKRVLTDKNFARHLGESGYNHAVNNFSWDKIIADTIKAYT